MSEYKGVKGRGYRERVMLCGEAAIGALSLDEDNDSPFDVEQRIIKLQAENQRLTKANETLRNRLEAVSSENDRLKTLLRDILHSHNWSESLLPAGMAESIREEIGGNAQD